MINVSSLTARQRVAITNQFHLSHKVDYLSTCDFTSSTGQEVDGGPSMEVELQSRVSYTDTWNDEAKTGTLRVTKVRARIGSFADGVTKWV